MAEDLEGWSRIHRMAPGETTGKAAAPTTGDRRSADSRTANSDSALNHRTVQRLLWAAAIVLPIFAILAALIVVRTHASGPRIPGGATVAEFVARPVREDRPAPDISLPALQRSGRITLRSFRGRVVVLNVWASWCGPCRLEAPALQRVWTENRGRGVVVIGIDHEDTRSSATAFRDRYELTYPLAFDPGGSVVASYGALGVPTTFVIDGAGVIRYRLLGRVTVGVLDAVLGRIAPPG
jgi:peroxiredoxin